MDRVIPAPPAPPTNMQPSLQPGHVGGFNPDSLGDRGRFSPNLNALQTGKFQPSNPNMALPDRQGPPGPQGFRDNKNHDSRILTIMVMDAVMLTCRLIVLIAIIIAMMVIVTTAVVMAVVAGMAVMVVDKVLINY